MGRSQESFHKKQVRKNKEKKRQDKEKKKAARKENRSGSSLDDMIAYVDESGNITDTPPDPGKKDKIELDDIEVSIPKKDPNEEPAGLRNGKLTMFNDSKGFGFIKDLESGADVFVHINNFLDEIVEGDKVSYETEHGPKGTYAIKVKKI
ncbi:cold-shock protein [Bacteroidota bacterium]